MSCPTSERERGDGERERERERRERSRIELAGAVRGRRDRGLAKGFMGFSLSPTLFLSLSLPSIARVVARRNDARGSLADDEEGVYPLSVFLSLALGRFVDLAFSRRGVERE